jgi:hypothetical protein
MIFSNGYLIPAFLVNLLGILFLKNQFLSLFLVLVEIFILLFYLYKLDLEKFVSWFLIFLGTSVEFQVLVSNNPNDIIYGFKNFKIFGLSLTIYFIILSLFYIIIKTILKFEYLNFKINNLMIVNILMLTLATDGIVMGIFNLIINDNEIRNTYNLISVFIGQIYLGIWPILLFILVSYVLRNSSTSGIDIEKSLISVFFSNALAPIIPATLGFSGSYGIHSYMLVPSSAIFLPFLLIFATYKEYFKFTRLFIFLVTIGVLVPMIFFGFVSGKLLILLIIIVPLSYIYILIQQKKFNIRLASILFLFLFILSISISILNNKTGTLFESKFKETNSLLGLIQTGGDVQAEPSTAFRVIEGVNVWFEYKEKPLQIFFGKGYMGSVRDHVQGFGYDSSGTFPQVEFDNSTFYSLHEFTGYFLKFGLFGLFVLIYIFKITLNNITNNPWIVIGCFWFLVFFGFSQTLSIFGIYSLAYGLFLSDKKT